MPSGANATTEGNSFRPSPSGMTRGSPVASSTKATRLLVVPRSMPMMRDNLVSLTQRLPEVIDHGAQVGAGGQRLLERGQEGRPPVRGRPIPHRRQRADQPRFFLGMAREQALALP